MLRRVLMLAAIGLILSACAASGQSSGNSRFHCDRNGDREERAAC